MSNMRMSKLDTIFCLLSQDFLGSGLDFPVNNTSFFLFFSGHVAGSVIISMDMRRTQRNRLGFVVDISNVLQSLRLLATRGHYTIDLAVGAAAGWVCDLLAGKYDEDGDYQECNNTTNGGKVSSNMINGFADHH